MMVEEIIDQLRSGNSTRLGNAQLFDGVSGLYSIEEDGELIYVGLSGNLKKRLKQHRNFNPRSSMFSYRYMLDRLKQTETECSTKQKINCGSSLKLSTRLNGKRSQKKYRI